MTSKFKVMQKNKKKIFERKTKIIVCERTVATIYVRRYETKKTTLLGILLVTFQVSF